MATDRSYVAENLDQLARLRRVTDRLSDAQLSHPMPDGWTVSGVLGHLAFWDEPIVQLLDRWGADGRGPAPVGFDEAHVDWINDAKKPLCLGLATREAARIAIVSAEAADKRVAELSDALLAANAKAGNPVSVHRAEHRREHLDEIERELKL